MDSTDGLSRGYEVVGTGTIQMIGTRRTTVVYSMYWNAIDGLGNLPKTEKTGCQSTVKLRNLISTSSEVLLQVVMVI
jgi:F-type H+-transporting ATPase subunit beta